MIRGSFRLIGAMAVALSLSPAWAQERTVKIAGFGAQTGAVRSFGVNAEAVMKAAADEINAKGGIKLKDGTKAKLAVAYHDDRCEAEAGINVVRRIASGDVGQLPRPVQR